MTPRPAGTVVLVREKDDTLETLLLLRNTALAFNGGFWVFPGGKIDREDYPYPDATEYEAARRAVVRETREEAGVDIAAEELIHIAHWTTPPGQSRRYSTWFFVCPLQYCPAIVIDSGEILDHCWLNPRLALENQACGNMLLPLPTCKTLELIARFNSLQDLILALRDTPIHIYPPGSEFYVPPVSS